MLKVKSYDSVKARWDRWMSHYFGTLSDDGCSKCSSINKCQTGAKLRLQYSEGLPCWLDQYAIRR